MWPMRALRLKTTLAGRALTDLGARHHPRRHVTSNVARSDHDQPLAGVRVLDMTRVLAGVNHHHNNEDR